MVTSRDDSERSCGNPSCANALAVRPGGGRQLGYCSRSCQQAAYRVRTKAERAHAKQLAARVAQFEEAQESSRSDSSALLAAERTRADRLAARVAQLEQESSRDDSAARAAMAEELRKERTLVEIFRRKAQQAEARAERLSAGRPGLVSGHGPRLAEIADLLDTLINPLPKTTTTAKDLPYELVRLADRLNPVFEAHGIARLDTEAARQRLRDRSATAARVKDTREDMRRQRSTFGLTSSEPLLPADVNADVLPDASEPGRWSVRLGYTPADSLNWVPAGQILGYLETNQDGLVAYLDDGYNHRQPAPRIERDGHGPGSVEEGRDWIVDAARARRAWLDQQVKAKLAIGESGESERPVRWGRHEIGTLRRTEQRGWTAHLPDGRTVGESFVQVGEYRLRIPVALDPHSSTAPEYKPLSQWLAGRLREYVAVHPPGEFAPVRPSVLKLD